MQIILCTKCKRNVLPKVTGECPSCGSQLCEPLTFPTPPPLASKQEPVSQSATESASQSEKKSTRNLAQRPVGVVILGILLLVGSINAAYSLWSILSSPALFLGYAIVNFHLKLTIITFAACGLSLLFSSRLGWWLVIIVMPIYILLSFLIKAFLADAYGSPGDGIFALTFLGIWFAVYALVVFYMTRNKVRCFFGIARPKRTPAEQVGRGDGDKPAS